MKTKTWSRRMMCLAGVLCLLTGPLAFAQEVTGELGSASATTSISGKQLPAPEPAFGGEIKNDALQSKAWWAPRIVPPKEAPNILLIITDDAGFGVPSTFGGVIPTPAMDRIAESGLRYNNIHSTALCSPTRAALITGRNHHSAGFGVISEQATGFPGYNSIIAEDKATIGRILLDNGYATSWFGKDHNTPSFTASQIGPFDRWPTGLGFEYFYGFVGGDANQWQPNLFRNTTQIYPFEGKPDWNLTTGMADDAIDYLTRMNQISPDKKFFVKYAPGATHAPHHPTREWVDKIQAMHLFDQGWNKLREQIFENQKKLGVIPADTQLEPWPTDVLKNWEDLTAEEQKLFIRQVEIFAAYAAYNDHEIGRVIQAIEDMGKLDDTLVIYINGDNGTSAEGGPMGTPNEVAFFNGINMMPVETQMKWYDAWGTEETYNHMSAGWSWAFQGQFSTVTCDELGAAAIRGALEQAGLKPETVDDVLMGCVLPAGIGQAPARMASRKAGIPTSAGAVTINKACGSAMKTMQIGHDQILVGSSEIVVAGGMESMTLAPYILPKARGGYRMGHGEVLDHMFFDGLQNPDDKLMMGVFGERCAEKYNFTREQQDAFAIASIERALAAMKNQFKDEITPVTVKSRHGDTVITEDQEPPSCNIGKIPSLRAAFKKDGTVTAASSSKISDGAAATVLMSAQKAAEMGIRPLATIVAHSTFSQDPEWFTTAPIGAIEKVLKKAGWNIDDVDLFEVNEAFATVTMAAMHELDIDHAKMNVNGGACALGHPIGASGARVVVTLINALRQRGLKKGVASLCIGGGEATALAIELP